MKSKIDVKPVYERFVKSKNPRTRVTRMMQIWECYEMTFPTVCILYYLITE